MSSKDETPPPSALTGIKTTKKARAQINKQQIKFTPLVSGAKQTIRKEQQNNAGITGVTSKFR